MTSPDAEAPAPHVREVRLERRRILVDGTPRLLVGGEVHYFRLHREDWAGRLDRLVEVGCDVLACYIPWLVHETADGEVDLTGRTSPYRDLVGFLDLAAERDLLVVARPGPFVMAELKNEGVPFRVYDENPGALPRGWDGVPGSSRTLDYLEPGYLDAAEGWLGRVLPVLAERQVGRGGPVAAVQVDNEVGMLSWVTNTPELTDRTLVDLAEAARTTWGDEVAERIGADPGDRGAWVGWVRAGATEGTARQQLALHHLVGDHHRDRYARYLGRLSEVARGHGIDVPLLVNVHGTGDGRGRTFPIGISQLSRAYAGVPQTTSGSDHYLGELTVENLPDVYVMNAFMAAAHDADQPITSLEFEAGSGDYGEDLSRLTAPETVVLKTRLCVAQGNRLLSYYLFTGGHNPPLDEPVGDGNDRIAFTGERHGFAAPVGPEGQVGPGFDGVRSALRAVRGCEHLLADMDEVTDDLRLGYVPDHYLTEYHHPGSAARSEQVRELERFRGMGSRDVLARTLLLAGWSYSAVDLSGATTSAGADLDPAGPAVALASPPVLGRATQERLAQFVRGGGRLLLHGVLPDQDDDGSPCTVLSDELGLRPERRVEGGHATFPSVRCDGLGGTQVEVRVGVLQHLSSTGSTTIAPLAVDVADGSPVVVEVAHPGGGSAVVVACDLPAHLPTWDALLGRLGLRPRVRLDGATPGIMVTTTADAAGQRLLHLLNVAPVEQRVRPLLAHGPDDLPEVLVPAREGLALPLGVEVPGGTLRWSTAELDGRGTGDEVWLRRGAGSGSAQLATDREVSGDGVTARRDGGLVHVSWPAGDPQERLVLTLT